MSMTDAEILGLVSQHPPEWHVCRCGKCNYAFAPDGTAIEVEKLIAALARSVKGSTDGNGDGVRAEADRDV
jgi:hypothetical protein